MKKLLALAALLAVAGALPATAGTLEQPEITDTVGDANGINGQGSVGGLENGPDTRPASWDGADFRAIWFSTAYVTEKVTDTEGKVLRVRYIPTAFRIHIKTEAPASSPGPTLVYRVPAALTCGTVFFQMWIRGSTPGPTDPPQGADIRKLNCGAAGATTGTLVIEGQVATLEYQLAQTKPALDVGTAVAPSTRPHVRPLFVAVTAPVIDETVLAADTFVVGSDVPPDVDCALAPEHPDCQT